jgi:hypothetical protein
MIEFLEALSECVESVVVCGVIKGVLGKEGFKRTSVKRRRRFLFNEPRKKGGKGGVQWKKRFEIIIFGGVKN